jgi:ABC-type taurine transport system substrate-binding protein
MSAAYVIRIDLTDAATRYILSTSTYQVGYAQTDIDTILVNTATAPAYSGAWVLEVDFYLFQGGQMLVHGVNFGTIQVGNAISLTYQTASTIPSPITEMTKTQQLTTTQTPNANVRTGLVPSTEQLDGTLIVLLAVLTVISLTVLIKLKKGKY